MGIISWVLYGIGIIVLCFCLYLKNKAKYFFGVVAAIFIWWGGILSGLSDSISYKELAKEVMLTEVPVQGEYNATVIMQITYKDGKIDKAILVPDSTRRLGPVK
jgi:hypothetical protein